MFSLLLCLIFSSVSSTNATATLPPTEYSALQDLYDATDGINWTWKPTDPGAHWNFTDPSTNPCIEQWQGIQCSPPDPFNMNHVLEIELSKYNLVGRIPASIANLPYLHVFSAHNNELRGKLPASIGTLSFLEILDVQNNHLEGSIPAELGNLTALVDLVIGRNLFHGPIPVSLGKLSRLEAFDVAINRLTGPLPDALSNLISLKHFLVMFNQLSGTIPESYVSMTHLATFNVFNNSLDGTFPAALCQWANLTTLTMAVNEFSGAVPACLADLPRLMYVDLYSNRLTGTIPAAFSHMPSLRVLYLNQNQLHGSISVLCSIKTLTQFYLQVNQFTGTIPACLSELTDLSDLFLHHNYYTGSISDSFGYLPNMKYIDLDTNLLSGTIPESFSNLRHLSFLFLFDNHLQGSLPPSFSRLANLTLLLLQNNHLTGPLTHVFNASVQTKLNTIQLSGNAFTGAIPEQPFLARGLYTFSVVDNCMKGSIPTVMCNHPVLNIIALDGMGTAKACRHMILPAISDSYVVTHPISGGVPPCLFLIPNLTTLHLSGNGLTGTLPADLQLGDRLVDLALSHNLLFGSIPRSIQQRRWFHLELSYNRFNGELQDDFNSKYVHIEKSKEVGVIDVLLNYTSSNMQLSLENNRLSGRIPASVMHLQNISILDGNMFTCDWQQTNLPQGDHGRDSYQCGSNAFDAQYYSWLIITTIVLALLLTAHLLRHRYVIFGAACELGRKWMFAIHVPELYEGKLKNFAYVCEVAQVIGRVAVWSTLFIVVVLLPLYAGMSDSYSTIFHQYAWTVSATYLAGVVPFVLTFAALLVLIVLVLALLNRYRRVYLKNETEDEDEDDTQRPRLVSVVNATKKQIYSAYFTFFAINFVTVCGVNVLFVYLVLYQSNRLQEAAQIGLSFFKGFWNSIGALYLMRWCFHTVASNETSGADFINTQLFVALFNNIAIPCLVVAAVSPDCFYDLFVTSPPIRSFFLYLECAIFANDQCILFYPVFASTQYTPPFTYSYQCGAQFITSYAPTFVYLGLEVAFLVPLLNVALLKLHERATPGSMWFRVLDYSSYMNMKPLNRNHTGKVQRDEFNPYFDANQLLVQLMTYLGIILTFGAVFPPLAVVMMVAIVSLIVTNKLVMGRFISNALEQNVPQYLDAIELDSRGVGLLHLNKLRISAWMVVSFAFAFYIVFFLDMLGNDVGFGGSFWVFIVLPLMPVGIYLVDKLSRAKGRASLWRRLRRRLGMSVVVVVEEDSTRDGLEMSIVGENAKIDTLNPMSKVIYQEHTLPAEKLQEIKV